MLYALCGFANFSSVGILLSGLSAMIPERRMDLISVSGKALWGALLASCLDRLYDRHSLTNIFFEEMLSANRDVFVLTTNLNLHAIFYYLTFIIDS